MRIEVASGGYVRLKPVTQRSSVVTVMSRLRKAIAPVFLAASFFAVPSPGQNLSSPDAMAAYKSMRRFDLTGGAASVSNLVLQRDRAQMTFSGTFYFPPKTAGRVTGAVFSGTGKFRVEAPPSLFERDNLQRLLKTDVIESDFSTAVLRFADDTFDHIGQMVDPTRAPSRDAQDLASDFEGRMVHETGANFAARILVALLNKEPGVFVAQFDGGRRGRFILLFDPQCRIPTTHFDINGGEKEVVFAHRRVAG